MLTLNLKAAALLLGCVVLAACQADSSGAEQDSIKHLRQATPNKWVSGQPTAEELKTLPSLGISTVINLRPKGEWAFDESKVATEAGLTHHHIPVAGAAGITLANAQALHDLLLELGPEPVLIHCASGNRVGGLVALGEAVIKGKGVDEAIAEGKRWGLTKLEPIVRERIKTAYGG